MKFNIILFLLFINFVIKINATDTTDIMDLSEDNDLFSLFIPLESPFLKDVTNTLPDIDNSDVAMQRAISSSPVMAIETEKFPMKKADEEDCLNIFGKSPSENEFIVELINQDLTEYSKSGNVESLKRIYKSLCYIDNKIAILIISDIENHFDLYHKLIATKYSKIVNLFMSIRTNLKTGDVFLSKKS